MIARPKISRNEWKTVEIGAFEVGNVAPFSCSALRRRRVERGEALDVVDGRDGLRLLARALEGREAAVDVVPLGLRAVAPAHGWRPLADARLAGPQVLAAQDRLALAPAVVRGADDEAVLADVARELAADAAEALLRRLEAELRAEVRRRPRAALLHLGGARA